MAGLPRIKKNIKSRSRYILERFSNSSNISPNTSK